MEDLVVTVASAEVVAAMAATVVAEEVMVDHLHEEGVEDIAVEGEMNFIYADQIIVIGTETIEEITEVKMVDFGRAENQMHLDKWTQDGPI